MPMLRAPEVSAVVAVPLAHAIRSCGGKASMRGERGRVPQTCILNLLIQPLPPHEVNAKAEQQREREQDQAKPQAVP
jgi:hypothetical protein